VAHLSLTVRVLVGDSSLARVEEVGGGWLARRWVAAWRAGDEMWAGGVVGPRRDMWRLMSGVARDSSRIRVVLL
jgi:hypothetical protein